jgi:hypothetical protein
VLKPCGYTTRAVLLDCKFLAAAADQPVLPKQPSGARYPVWRDGAGGMRDITLGNDPHDCLQEGTAPTVGRRQYARNRSLTGSVLDGFDVTFGIIYQPQRRRRLARCQSAARVFRQGFLPLRS